MLWHLFRVQEKIVSLYEIRFIGIFHYSILVTRTIIIQAYICYEGEGVVWFTCILEFFCNDLLLSPAKDFPLRLRR